MISSLLKRTFIAALIGTGLPLASVQAQNPFFAPGDLMLFFQKQGDEDTIFVNLGSATTLYRGAAAGPSAELQKLNILNINAELTAAYGAAWPSDTGIYTGLAAVRSSSIGTGVIDGDQTRTLYASRSRTSVGIQGEPGSVPWDLSTVLPYTVSSSQILSMANTFESRYTTQVAISPTSISTIDDQNPFLAPGIQDTAFKGFAGGVQQAGRATAFGNFGPAGQVEFALDLYRIVPREDSETAAVEVTGTTNIGTYEGTIVVGTDGSVSFMTQEGVRVPEITVEKSTGGQIVEIGDGQFLDLGTALPGETGGSQVLSINNTGSAPLTGLAITKDGPNAADFEFTPLSVDSLEPGRVAQITVTFKPLASGSLRATLRIASNDADENPYDIELSGTGIVVAPEISIGNSSGTVLVDGDANSSQGFDPVLIGSSSAPREFTIRNVGNQPLAGLGIAIGGANPADFEAIPPPVTVLAPGQSATFALAFKPTAVGNRSATILVASNDSDENPFDIAVTGIGRLPVPEITVKSAGTTLIDGAATSVQDFGTVDKGYAGNAQYFIIRNTGTAGLIGLEISNAGANPGDFVVRQPSSSSLSPNASTLFSVTFKPTATGNRTAVIRIASNDEDESSFDIELVGTATLPEPELDVQQPPRSSLVDGKSKRSFGTAKAGMSRTKTFTIRNAGKANLTGLSVASCGRDCQSFKVTNPLKTRLLHGEATTFKVTFKPDAKGPKTASVYVFSNDADEYPFKIKVSGLGAPK